MNVDPISELNIFPFLIPWRQSQFLHSTVEIKLNGNTARKWMWSSATFPSCCVLVVNGDARVELIYEALGVMSGCRYSLWTGLGLISSRFKVCRNCSYLVHIMKRRFSVCSLYCVLKKCLSFFLTFVWYCVMVVTGEENHGNTKYESVIRNGGLQIVV